MGQPPEDIIRRELSPAEQLLWAGRPRQGLILRGVDVFLIPFSIYMCWDILFGQVGVALGGNVPVFCILGTVPFLLVGFYLLVGRFWLDARLRARTTYGVTSERIIIVSRFISHRVISLSIDRLTDVSLTERSSGGGMITFGSVPFLYNRYAGTELLGFGYSIPYFDLSAGAREVYEIIVAARRAATQRE